MRTIWNGSINFGLVNIPIGLAVAQQRKDVSFRTLHRECGTPIKQKRWCPVHERDVEADELVKGWEFAKGQFVLVEESDLEAVALTRSQSIDIKKFVDLEDVDPIYFDRAYYLAPADAAAQRRPYVLLLRAMQEANVAAIGKFVLWGKENLCLIRPHGDSLALDRDQPLRRRGRGRPDLLRPHLLPRSRAGAGGAAAVRAAAERDERERDGGARPVRAAGQGAALPDPAEGRRARARDALPRRRRLLPGRDRARAPGNSASA